MINFRYHLVSLIAVFLALTIGIALGATVVDRGIVNSLRSQLHSVDKKADATNKKNDELSRLNKQATDYVNGIEVAAVQGRLTGHSVLVFAERGVDSGSVKSLVGALQAAGADAPAIVWLESKWKLSDRATRAALVTALATSGTGTVTDARRDAFGALAKRLAHEPAALAAASSTTSSVPPPTDVLEALRHAGFLSIQRAGDAGRDDLSTFGGADAAAVLVVGDGARDPVPQLAATFANAFVTSGTTLLVGEVDPSNADPATRGDAVAPVRSNADLRTLVSTVDDADLSAGRIDVVLALAELADAGRVGHYGFGSGAEAPAPAL
jgi:hypothetical protein